MQAIGQFAAGIAHEFNNLLVGILGNAELLLDTPNERLPTTGKRPVEDIYRCGKRAATLTQQLLSFAKKKQTTLRVFDLNELVGSAEVMLRRLIGERITLGLHRSPDRCFVYADEGEMEQALLNLVINARDAMPDGGTLTLRCANIECDEAYAARYAHAHVGRFVELSVADTGRGMSVEVSERIFEPFFTTKPVGEGTGLGLSTVFADVTKLGGHVTVESAPGAGTHFRICLPHVEGSVAASAEPRQANSTRPPVGQETILICDDEEAVLRSISFLLENEGYDVIPAWGAREALDRASSDSRHIALLLTDVIMPDMNGPELAKKLLETHSGMKVLYMSGYPSDILDVGGSDSEPVEFLQKPPMGDTLFRRVREVLDRDRPLTPDAPSR